MGRNTWVMHGPKHVGNAWAKKHMGNTWALTHGQYVGTNTWAIRGQKHMGYSWENTHIKQLGNTWEKTYINYMGKKTYSHLFYAHYIRILCVGIPTVGLPTYNMCGFEGGIRGIWENLRIPHACYAWANMRILYVGIYMSNIRGQSSQNSHFKSFSPRNAQYNCALRIIEGRQICVYYARENMRGIYVGNRPKLALFTRNADVVTWEFPRTAHAY